MIQGNRVSSPDPKKIKELNKKENEKTYDFGGSHVYVGLPESTKY
jgi:hypothetical protein